ncbi:MAG: DUF983 domain-containing protein [Gemmatimonadaceae bacterium]|nr:DUF983 domain-containing protein [Gemmatimonadaceae bacterium]
MATPTAVPSSGARILRACTLRCPECGGGGLFRGWLRIKDRCPTCALKLDRGTPGHFVGAYLVNLIVAELLFAFGLLTWLVAVWPDVPWDTVRIAAVAAMVVTPLTLYPFTRTIWLAADLIIDPLRPTDR